MLLHPKQRLIAQSDSQFKVIRAGRKSGKTTYEVEALCYKATVSTKKLPNLTKHIFPTGRKVLYVAPTQDQARGIVWEALKTRLAGIGKPNEQRLEMIVPNEDGLTSLIRIGGWENRENYRGLADVVHITFDETDSMKGFFVSLEEIYRPMTLDANCSMDFIGTPKKENPNLKRLEKEAEGKIEWDCFHFTSKDNPHVSQKALDFLTVDMDKSAYKQEILAEHIEESGALFRYTSLVDVFSNTITKSNEKYLIVDVAGDGSNKTTFSFWEGLEEYRRESFARLNTESIIDKIREYASNEQIAYSQIAVDAIGIGEGVASSSLLDGIIGYKSSYQAIKTDISPVRLPNVHYTKDASLTSDYKNLRSQCVFTLADLVNNHKIASKVEDVRLKEKIIEELALYQDASIGDGKRMPTQKEDIKVLLGHSPDDSDTWIMRMYFVIKEKMLPQQSEEAKRVLDVMDEQFTRNENRSVMNDTR